MARVKTVTNGKLPEGYFSIGRKIYTQCEVCEGIIRVNKPILGDLHICAE